MRKLTNKVKYKLHAEGYAELYAVHKVSGKRQLFATCHESTVYCILDNKLTFKDALEQGLIRMA